MLAAWGSSLCLHRVFLGPLPKHRKAVSFLPERGGFFLREFYCFTSQTNIWKLAFFDVMLCIWIPSGFILGSFCSCSRS